MKLFGAVLCAFASAAVTDRQEEDITGTVRNEELEIFLILHDLRFFTFA